MARQDRLPHDLVNGIVAPHVFTDREEHAVTIEQRSSMQSAGPLEQRLSWTQCGWQVRQQFRVESQFSLRRPDSADAYSLDRCLPTDAAARGGEDIPPETLGIEDLSGTKRHIDGIALPSMFSAASMDEMCEIRSSIDDALGEEESSRKLEVIAGCSRQRSSPAEPLEKIADAGEEPGRFGIVLRR